jgi:subtilisin family serine protease
VDGWDLLTSASNIVVAVLDTGIRYTHEDLAANMWVNPNNAGHGTNAVSGSNDPNDDNGHGTLVAGVLGAVGNNGKGVTGVAWSVQLMACKCFDSSGNSSDSQIIACVDYARTNGARIINGSFDSTGFSLALSNAIASARDAGIIYVASCGNNSANIDATPHYPAAYGLDNIISVAYTTRTDALGGLSNFGATNVDLAAPGDQIVSTFSATDNFYYPPPNTFNLAGTSFAAPYVSGALALMLARFPTEDYHLIISRLLNGVDPLPALSGKCATGGRLNLRKALSPPIRLTALPSNGGAPFQFVSYVGPNRSNIVQSSSNLISWLPLYTNITTTNWTFDFSDADSTNTTLKFYRVNSAP